LVGSGWGKGFPASILKQVQTAGATVILDDKVDVKSYGTGALDHLVTFTTAKGVEIQTDFLVIATGNVANTCLVEALSPASIAPTTKRIKVKENLQIDAPNASLSDIYAIGDCTDTKDRKMAAATSGQASIVAASIIASIGGKSISKVYKPMGDMMIVTFGSKAGSGQLFGFTVGAWVAAKIKSKELFVPMFNKAYGVKA